MTNKQIDGAIFFTLISIIIFIVTSFNYSFMPSSSIDYMDINSGSVAIELIASKGEQGIYFVPEKTHLSKILDISHFGFLNNVKNINSIKISNGTSIEIGADQRIKLGMMSASKRLLLNIPIDINRASILDLILIPGIGEKLAFKIAIHRKKLGKYNRIEDLMEIPGIKEKRLSKFKKYLCVCNTVQS